MEAELLPDGRIRLVLSRSEHGRVGNSLLEARSVGDDPKLRTRVGVSMAEVGLLDDEWRILRRELFGMPKFHSERDRQMYLERMPTEPRRTGTSWDDLPKMEAELLPDGRVGYTLAWRELSIFAGAMDEMLHKLAPDKSISSRGEVSARTGHQIEEFEALRDELWRAGRRLRGKPEPEQRHDPPRPLASSGRVGDVATFAAQHRLARVRSRERAPVTDKRMEV